MLNTLNWQPTCCAWHGEYAEARTSDGGMLRLKRASNVAGILSTQFTPAGKALDVDAEGVPAYVERTEAEVLALLA